MYISSKRTAVVEVPKCASSSLISAISPRHNVSDASEHFTLRQHQQKNPDIELGLALIREPLSRLRSGVEFCMASRPSVGVADVKAALVHSLHTGLPSSLSVVLYPQYSFLLCNLPVKLYLLSNIELLLRDLGVSGPPPIKNRTRQSLSLDQVLDVFGEGFVREFYALDFALYDSLCSIERGVVEVQSAETYIYSLRGKAL
jgi:hypothetical protein